MRPLSVIFTAMIISMFVVNANAQDHAAHDPDQDATVQYDTSSGMSMMQSGMMSQQGMNSMCCKMMKGGMMGHHSPMHAYKHLINHLPNMKTKLGLSDDQLNQLKAVQSNFLKRKADWEADIEKKEIDLDLLLDKKASVSDVRKTLKSIYDAKLDMKVASYETAQKMKVILSAEQQEKLDEVGSMCIGKGMMGLKSEKM